MKTIILRIEDNSEKIKTIKELTYGAAKISEGLGDKIDELQEEKLIEIASYIRCMQEDYWNIIGKKDLLWVKDPTGSVSISAYEDVLYVNFQLGSHSRIEIHYNGNEISKIVSTREGISDLMRRWTYIKPQYQETIEKIYKDKISHFNNEKNSLERMLKEAKEFNV